MPGIWDRVALEMSLKGRGAEGTGCGRPVPALSPSAPDGVCLQHTRYHTRKPCVTTSMPNTTHESRDMSIVSWSWVLRKACAARGKTSYFKSWLQGKLVVQGQGSWPRLPGGPAPMRGVPAPIHCQGVRLCGLRCPPLPQRTRAHTAHFLKAPR